MRSGERENNTAYNMEIYDVTKKLLGPIEPIGDTHVDDERHENLKSTINLIHKLLCDLIETASYSNCPEHSRSRAGKTANEFLKELTNYKQPS